MPGVPNYYKQVNYYDVRFNKKTQMWEAGLVPEWCIGSTSARAEQLFVCYYSAATEEEIIAWCNKDKATYKRVESEDIWWKRKESKQIKKWW